MLWSTSVPSLTTHPDASASGVFSFRYPWLRPSHRGPQHNEMLWKRIPRDDEWVLVASRGEVARIRAVDRRYRLVVLGSSIRVFDGLAKAKRAGIASWKRIERHYAAGLHVMRV